VEDYYILALDTSGNWDFIACVVFKPRYVRSLEGHVASLDRRVRSKIIRDVLEFIDDNCYGVCLNAKIRYRVRELRRFRNNKRWAWEYSVYLSLKSISQHLKNKNYWPISEVYADGEFQSFVRQIATNFNTTNIHIGKYSETVLADVLAYVNLRQPCLLKKYRNIIEL